MLGSRSEANPFVAEAAFDATCDHSLQHFAVRLITHTVQQLSARPHFLQRGKIAALMVYARHAIADKLPGNECQAFTAALQRLFRSVGRPRTDPVEWVPRTVGNPSR